MPRNVEAPIPRDSLLADLVAESRKAGVKPRDAELEIWKLAIRRCKGNVTLMAAWMEVELVWCRRHLRRLGLQEELDAARATALLRGKNGKE